MSPSASTIILEYVCPTLGMIVANQMFYAPFQDVQTSIARGSLGDLNPLPWAVMLGNCCGWVTYSILIHNYFIFFANAPGFLLAMWFNLAASKLLFQQQLSTVKLSLPVSSSLVETVSTITPETPLIPLPVDTHNVTGVTDVASPTTQLMDSSNQATTLNKTTTNTTTITILDDIAPPVVIPYQSPQHDYWVMVMTAFWVAIIAIVGFGQNMSDNTRQYIVGVTVNLNLVFFYGAPLSTIATILRERNTASLHVPTMLTNTANGVFWTAYGLAVVDFFVIVPNGIGALLGGIELVLYLTFPRRPAVTEEPIIPTDKSTDEEEVVVASGETTMITTMEPTSTDNLGVSPSLVVLPEAIQSKEEPRYIDSSVDMPC